MSNTYAIEHRHLTVGRINDRGAPPANFCLPALSAAPDLVQSHLNLYIVRR